MPTKAQIRKRWEERLAEHPKVKALRPRQRGKVAAKRGVPKLVAEAMQDPDVARAVTAMRRLMRYERRADDIVRRHQRGEKLPLNDQMALVRQGENIERDIQEAVRKTARAARANPAIEAYAAAIASQPDDTDVLDDLPSYLTRDEKAAMRYVGIEPDEFDAVWKTALKSHGRDVVRLLASGEITKELERLEASADQLQYRRSPRHLVKRDILTLGGDVAQFLLILIIGGLLFLLLVAIVGLIWIALASIRAVKAQLAAIGAM